MESRLSSHYRDWMPSTVDIGIGGEGAEPAHVERGFLHLHTRLSASHASTLELAGTLLGLVDLLVAQGFVAVEELRAQAARVRERLAATEIGRGLELALLDDRRDKYNHPEAVQVDCAPRLPLCRAACCALDRALSVQDVEEGAARWDLGRPYRLRRADGGACCHLDANDRRCGVYERRPLGCRTYSCARDPRIWSDFEQRIPNQAGIDALFSWQSAPRLADAAVATTEAQTGTDDQEF
jgi:Fe-S-cluster containining protein